MELREIKGCGEHKNTRSRYGVVFHEYALEHCYSCAPCLALLNREIEERVRAQRGIDAMTVWDCRMPKDLTVADILKTHGGTKLQAIERLKGWNGACEYIKNKLLDKPAPPSPLKETTKP